MFFNICTLVGNTAQRDCRLVETTGIGGNSGWGAIDRKYHLLVASVRTGKNIIVSLAQDYSTTKAFVASYHVKNVIACKHKAILGGFNTDPLVYALYRM